MADPYYHPGAEAVRSLVEQLHENLDTLPYHTILGVPRNAGQDEIRRAFYERAEQLHPDRFHNLQDTVLRRKIYEVYKRVAEAYRVLEDPVARQEYDAGLKKRQYRYLRQEGAGPRVKQADEGITSPQAKRFFQLGLDALASGDLKGAKLNFGFALSMEPGNESIEAKIAEVETRLKQ